MLEHHFSHVEGKNLIDVDSTKYDSNYVPLQIDSLPYKNIWKLKENKTSLFEVSNNFKQIFVI